MLTLKRSIVPFAVKAINVKERTFEGLSATWDLDLGGDIIHIGAFTKTIAMWKSGAFAIPLIDQHRYGSAVHDVLGSAIELEERTEGLWSKFEVDEAPEGDKLLRHIDKKRINGLSIGYESVKPMRDEVTGIRHLHEVKLHEISAVIWPMNPNAIIYSDSVKSLYENLNDEQKQELTALLQGKPATAVGALYPADKTAALRSRLTNLRVRSVLATAQQETNS